MLSILYGSSPNISLSHAAFTVSAIASALAYAPAPVFAIAAFGYSSVIISQLPIPTSKLPNLQASYPSQFILRNPLRSQISRSPLEEGLTLSVPIWLLG
uniref:Uncharacterized protein n=1 Tax=Picea glauca TaxID=3330 RepID=A0A117NIL8_PICGL|nr:hypothetical protein ABT39_MTgene9 [Picea glauca]QHR87974.1 hypothetical protein Q903MT_gene1986 [Picea sitchensis]